MEGPYWVVVLGLVLWLIRGVEAAAMVADPGVEELHVGFAAAPAVAAVLVAAAVVAGELVVIQVAVVGSASAAMATVVGLLLVKLSQVVAGWLVVVEVVLVAN